MELLSEELPLEHVFLHIGASFFFRFGLTVYLNNSFIASGFSYYVKCNIIYIISYIC